LICSIITLFFRHGYRKKGFRAVATAGWRGLPSSRTVESSSPFHVKTGAVPIFSQNYASFSKGHISVAVLLKNKTWKFWDNFT